MLLLRVTVSIADLFGPIVVDSEAVDYDGLLGWLASFYAGHSGPYWRPVVRLLELSGDGSHMQNFKQVSSERWTS